MKISVWNLAHVITSWTSPSPTNPTWDRIGLAGVSPQIGEISLNTFVTFLLHCPFFSVEPSHSFLRWMAQTTCFRQRTALLGVGTMGDVIWGKIPPKNFRKGGVNKHFQAKTPKSIHRNISGTIRQTNDWGPSSDHERHFVGGLPLGLPGLPQRRQPCWKSIWRHMTPVGVLIWTKFGTMMQNNTPITAKWSRSKPELVFQYGGRLFFQTGSNYISAMNWDVSTKFGLLIVRMICAKHCEKLSKIVEVTAKILSVPFFWTRCSD